MRKVLCSFIVCNFIDEIPIILTPLASIFIFSIKRKRFDSKRISRQLEYNNQFVIINELYVQLKGNLIDLGERNFPSEKKKRKTIKAAVSFASHNTIQKKVNAFS